MSRFDAMGDGSPPRRWRGRWRAALTIGYTRDGKPNRKYVYGATQAECREKFEQLKRDRNDGLLAQRDPLLREWLNDWLELQSARRKPKTVQLHREQVARLGNQFLNKTLSKITPMNIEREMLAIKASVSADAANRARSSLHVSLGEAHRRGIIRSNPVAVVEKFAHRARVPTVWTGAEVHRFIAATGLRVTRVGRSGDSWEEFATPHYPLIYLLLTTGLRVGEALALDWDDWFDGKLSVSKTFSGTGAKRQLDAVKTSAGARVLTLPRDTIAVLDLHRAALRRRGSVDGVMFPTGSGKRLDSRNVGRTLTVWAERAGVPRLTPHELRHTFASMAIANGMTPVDLARQLGHADASFTLRVYTHFFQRVEVREPASLSELTGSNEAEWGILWGTPVDYTN